MGGKVAMHVALTRPELVQQLVVVDVAPVAYPVSVGAHAEYIEAMLSLDLSLVKSLSEARALLGVSDEAVREFLLTNLVFEEGKARWLPALHVLLASLQHVRGTSDYHGQTFSGPTLFVSGADSHYVLPSHHERIRQLFPRAEMKSIAGAGHWVHADKPTEFLNIVTSFL
jgi:esterase